LGIINGQKPAIVIEYLKGYFNLNATVTRHEAEIIKHLNMDWIKEPLQKLEAEKGCAANHIDWQLPFHHSIPLIFTV